MSSIDERVVSMKFNNSQFQSGIASTMSSLTSLKKNLNLDKEAQSIDKLDQAGKKFSLENMGKGIETIASKFSAMSIVGITALTNLTNKAVNAGIDLVKSITVEPIMDGFSEYELKMGSIQTILANTSKDGTKLKDVSAALDDLNTYADKTIYNFGDMTRNIGLFTNAGIKLKDATSMIKGFSNEAAASGTQSQQASGAAYQLSQALSKGKVTLEDWRSLTNAGMGNKNMQTGLIDIAKAMGVFNKTGQDSKKVAEDFNGSLEKGWLTADVMQKYLQIQAGDLSREQMKSIGLSNEQIDSFIKQQKIAEEAATKVRTWTQLIGTLQEAVGSSWATTAELLLGDFDEATKLFTGINDTIGPMISAMGDARNKLIKDWVKAGGRASAYASIGNIFNAIVKTIQPVLAAFREIFPPITGQRLAELTKGFENFTKKLIPSAKNVDNIKRTFKGLFAVLDIGWNVIQIVIGLIGDLFGQFKGGPTSILEATAKLGDFLVHLRDMWQESSAVVPVVQFLQKVIRGLGNAFRLAVGGVILLVQAIAGFAKNGSAGFKNAVDKMGARLDPLKGLGDTLVKVWERVMKVFDRVKQMAKPVVDSLGRVFSGIGDLLQNAFKDVNFNGVLDLLNTGLLAGIALLIKKFLTGGIEVKTGFLDGLKEGLEGLTGVFSAMQTSLKADALMKIAIAIGILTLSVVALSMIDSGRLTSAITGLSFMFAQLLGAMMIFEKISGMSGMVKLPFIAAGLMLLAGALAILSISVVVLSKLKWEELAKGLVGVTAMLGALAGTVKLMAGNAGRMISAGAGLMLIAVAIRILVKAVQEFAKMKWEELAKGLSGVAGVLLALGLFTRLQKVSTGAVGQAASLVILAVAIKLLASSVKEFAGYDWATLGKGLAGLGGLLLELAIFTRVVSGAKGMVATATGLVILGAAMKIMASALKDFAAFSWEEIGRGLVAMAGALAIVTIAINLLPATMLLQAAGLVVVGAALKIIASAVKDMAGMSWEEIGRGMTVLAGSLAILIAAMYGMQFAIVGAAAMIIVAGALALLAPAMVALGGMSWDDIGRGLTVLAAALAIIGVAGLLIGPVVPALIGLGIAITLLGVGVALIGAGLMAFSVGLATLAAVGGAATAVLVASVTAMLALIPYALEQFALGIVAFAKVIGDSAPTMLGAMVKLMLAILDAIKQVAPAIIDTLMTLVVKLVNTIRDKLPWFVQAGMDILIGFLNGIGNNIGRVVTSAVNVIVNFLNGIANNLGRIISAGANIIISFIEGVGRESARIAEAGAQTIIKFVNSLATTVETHSGEMRAAGGRLGGALIDGMTGGVFGGIGKIASAAWDMGRQAVDAIKRAIDSHSPSKETRKIGGYFSDGFALGIQDLAGKSESAANEVGTTAISTLKGTMAAIGDAFDANMDLNPTVTPVLDLSLIKRDSGLIGNMMPAKAISVDASYASAAAISSKTPDTVVDTSGNTVAPSSFTFVQNNNSPKALDTAEVYRNTKNQLSQVKGKLVTA